MSTVDEILGEFIDAWKAGERPDLDAFLERVPAGDRDELAAGIAAWLHIAPTPELPDPPPGRPSPRSRRCGRRCRAAEALRPPLPESLPVAARARRPRRPRRRGAGWPSASGSTIATARSPTSSELERGELDAGRLSRRLVDALSEMLGGVRIALPSPPAPAAPSQAFFRADEEAEDWIVQDIDALSRAALASAPAPMDELDRLFLGGPER